MNDANQKHIENFLEGNKEDNEKDLKSVLTSGTYYSNVDGTITDLYEVTYNPDAEGLLDIVCVSNDDYFTEDVLKNILNENTYYNPFEEKEISYKDGTNVDILIDTIHKFYSNQASGISSNKADSTETDNIQESVKIFFNKNK